jgi:hypothetical protein
MLVVTILDFGNLSWIILNILERAAEFTYNSLVQDILSKGFPKVVRLVVAISRIHQYIGRRRAGIRFSHKKLTVA